MVNERENKEMAKDIFLKGEEKLKSAEILLENRFYDDAASRIYYAVYYFARALLFLLGEDPKTHKGMLSLFGLKVIKNNLLDGKFGRILSNLHEKRERGDYSIYSYLDEDTTKQLLGEALEFKVAISELLKEKFSLQI